MTATLTKADAIKALDLYGQHHPECAAVWPAKPCDCGLAALGIDKAVPTIDRQQDPEEPLELSRSERRVAAPRPIQPPLLKPYTCTSCGATFTQPRRKGRPFTRCPECRS